MEGATTEAERNVAKDAPKSGFPLDIHLRVYILSLMVRW